MAYIDYKYYTESFHGTMVTAGEFPCLADRASDIIDAIVQKPVPLTDGAASAAVKKATAYEVDVLAAQGGESAINGQADVNTGAESLGSYSIGSGYGASANSVTIPMLGGIPVSRLTIALLSADGLMCRWAYAGVHAHGE